MGRMTYSFMNDVFFGKIKSLVIRAIEDARREDENLKITYEALVDELDVGDSFTTQLIEVLVKELADRRHRSNAADKQLISKRTAHALLELSKYEQYPQRLRSSRSRSGVFRGESSRLFVLPQPDEHSRYDSVDDDEVEDAAESGNGIEGARIDSHHIYDAFRPSLGPHGRREGQYLPSPWSLESADTERSSFDLAVSAQSGPSYARRLPYGLGRRPTVHRDTPSATSLTRQPSIRRPRNRMMDFNEFASRRRSAQRSTTMQSPELPETYTGWFLPRRSPSQEEPVIPAPPENMYDSSESEASRVRSTLFEPPEPEEPNSRSVQMDASDVTENPWRDTAPPAPSSLLSLSRNLRGDTQGFPRLRRGGVRPPESLQGATPFSEVTSFARAMASFTDLPRALSGFEREFGMYFPDDGIPSSDSGPSRRTQDGEETNNLPTPRSISPTPPALHESQPQRPVPRSLSLSAPLPNTSGERED